MPYFQGRSLRSWVKISGLNSPPNSLPKLHRGSCPSLVGRYLLGSWYGHSEKSLERRILSEIYLADVRAILGHLRPAALSPVHGRFSHFASALKICSAKKLSTFA